MGTILLSSTCSAAFLSQLFHLKCNRVQQLARLGVMKRLRRGEYDLLESVESYVAYLQGQLLSNPPLPSLPKTKKTC